MKNYERPIVMINEDLAEGVYAASGAGQGSNECWTIYVKRDQEDAGGYSTYRLYCDHSTALQHISVATTMTITFCTAIEKAEYEDASVSVSVSGNSVTLSRECHGNSYLSGDNFKSLLKVWTVDGSAPELEPPATISCTKTVNVQGNF